MLLRGGALLLQQLRRTAAQVEAPAAATFELGLPRRLLHSSDGTQIKFAGAPIPLTTGRYKGGGCKGKQHGKWECSRLTVRYRSCRLVCHSCSPRPPRQALALANPGPAPCPPLAARHLNSSRTFPTSPAVHTRRQRLVVLGTGWGGARLARDIDPKKFDLTIISPRNHMVFTPLLGAPLALCLLSLPVVHARGGECGMWCCVW